MTPDQHVAELASATATMRTAGALLIAGAAIMFIGASVPFITSLGGDAWYGSPAEVLAAIAKNPTAWRWANALIAVAAVVTAIGLAGTVLWSPPSRFFATAGLVAFGVGAALDVVARVLDMRVGPLAAVRNPDSPLASTYESFHQLSEGLIQAFILIAFIALALLGIAALQHEATWLGAVLIVLGAGGLVLEVVGAAIPALVYIGTATLGVWMLFGPASRSL